MSGGYDVRYAAKTNYNASPDTTVTVPAYVAPVISFSGVPTTVTTETAIPEAPAGVIGSSFDITKGTEIQATLTASSESYPNVRVVVTGLNSGVQLIAQDTTGTWYNIAETGWGPAAGFNLTTTTTPVYLVANTAGTYTATINLVDVSTGSIIATTTASITANQDQSAPASLTGVAPTTSSNNDGQITGTTVAMEYKLSTDSGYTAATDTAITGLPAGTYDVRYAAKTNYNASPDTTVTVPAYVAPVISFSGVPTAVTVGVAIPETSGVIGSSFDTTKGTEIQATLTKGSVDYTNVRVVVTGLNSGVQLIAQDTTGTWYNIVETGWGPVGGFPIATVTTPVYLVANTAGPYTATINLVDVSNSDAVLATTTATINATPGSITDPASSVTATSATLNGTVGGVGATYTSFWYGTTPTTEPLPSSSPTLPDGWNHIDSLVAVSAGNPFTADITGLTSSLPYNFIAWTQIGGIWYPGAISSFTTLAPAPVLKTDDTLSDLTVSGATVTGFVPATLTYDVQLAVGTTTVPTVTATANDVADGATAVVTPAGALPGLTTVLVTAQDTSVSQNLHDQFHSVGILNY